MRTCENSEAFERTLFDVLTKKKITIVLTSILRFGNPWLYCIIKKFLPLKYCLILFFAGSAGCKVNYVKACVSGGGGCLRTSAVQRKFVRLTILLRIRTWWNQGLFYWYEEWFISDIIQLCYEIQEIFQQSFSRRFQSSLLASPKTREEEKTKIFIKRKNKRKKSTIHVIFHAIQTLHRLIWITRILIQEISKQINLQP